MPSAVVGGASVVTVPSGVGQPKVRPGDFILTHTFVSRNPASWFGPLIRFGQRLRFRGADKTYAWWNHAALVVGENGDIVEALGGGVTRTNLSHYRPNEYAVVNPLMSSADRMQAVAVAKRMVGQSYGFLTIVSLGLSLLTGSKFNFGVDGQFICSGLVARCIEKGDAILDRTPSHCTPADLARYFGVTSPA